MVIGQTLKSEKHGFNSHAHHVKACDLKHVTEAFWGSITNWENANNNIYLRGLLKGLSKVMPKKFLTQSRFLIKVSTVNSSRYAAVSPRFPGLQLPPLLRSLPSIRSRPLFWILDTYSSSATWHLHLDIPHASYTRCISNWTELIIHITFFPPC